MQNNEDVRRMQQEKSTPPKKSVLAKIGRGIGIFILSIIALIVLVLILIQTAPVQNFARKKIVAFLENKLKTRVEIKRLDIDFPKMLVLEGVYIEDRTKDTLIAGNQLKVDIDMFKLIHSEIQINEINLNQITAKIKRQLPDTVFNYQFIVDAFSSPKDTAVKKDTAAMKMAIEKIIVDKTRLVYFDVVTGNDVDVYLNHFDTRINTFDPANLRYDVPSIVVKGIRGRVNQTKPMEVTAVVSNPDPAVKNETPKFLNFTNKEMLLSDFDLAYSNDVSALATHITLKDLKIHPESFDLKNTNIAIKDIQLKGLNGFVRMGSSADTKVVKLTNENSKEVAAATIPWKFTVASIRFDDNNFVYDDNTQPRLSRGMDFAHLNLQDLVLHADNFLFHNDTIAANIVETSMKEKSGFVLNKFQTNVTYTNQGASLQNLLIQTPGSEIKRSAVIRYPSLAAIQKEMGLLEMDIDIDNSFLQVKDILTFVPTLASQPAFRNPSAKIYFDSRLKGTLNRLEIQEFKFRGLSNTSLDLSGVVGNAMDAKNVTADLNIRKFNTSRGDIMSLAPAGSLPKGISLPETMALNGRIRGGMRRMEINQFQFRDSRNTIIDISGVVNNAADAKNVSADMNIRKFYTTRTEIMALAPAGSIPKNITIPQTMSLNGKIKGGMKDVFANINLNTSLGSAKVNGRITNPTDSINARYNATISTTALNLGAIMQQPENLGTLTASFTANGRGFDPDRANASIKGMVTAAEVKKYVYHDLTLDASIANQKFTANAAMQDPNIHFALQAEGDMGGNLPSFVFNANIDSIKTFPLHLTPDPIIYHGKITANVPELNLDALNGRIDIINSLLVMNGKRIVMDSLSVVASHINNEQVIGIKTDFVNAILRGQYKLQQMGDIMMEAIQPYYAINTTGKQVNVDPYNFTINANVIDHPTLHGFIPTLTRFDGLTIKSNFSSSDGWNANIAAPHIVMGTNTIDNLTMDAVAANNALNVTANVNQVTSGASIALYGTAIKATLANNKIDFGLSIKDKVAKTKYRFGALLSQEPDSVYAFSLKPDSLMLNYNPWSISADNLIRFGSTVVNARNFDLSQGNQHLVINSLNSTANSPLQIDFANFNIATLSAFVQSDSLLVDGILNGNVQLRNILQQPNFTTDLTLNNLAVKRDTIGDVNIKVNNNTANVFATNVAITGRGNDISLTGNYYLKPANNSNFDLNLDIKQLPFKTIEALSMGAVDSATGNLTGQVAINGTVKSPNVDGGITFNQTGFNLAMLGSYFTIDGETIKVNNQGVRFDTFTIKDSANNSLVIDGLAGTTNFTNYDLNLTVKARNFRGLNSQKTRGSLYYGQLFFNTSMSIKGTETAPIVDGSLRINENTNLSLVLPQAEPGIVDRQGVIEFVDMDAPMSDSLFKSTLAKYDSSFNTSAVTGFDISANIEIVKEANFNVIVDEANGDFLNIKGAALLTGGIDPSGKITMTGTYEIESGGYELSFNFLRRRFDIEKGSKITWTGEPTTADLAVTAIYVANTSPMDLVQNQIADPGQRGYYQQKLPFQVRLIVKGEIMKPLLTFDITLPTENNVRVNNEILTTVNTRLDQVRAEPSELNKQVFALLLLNRFVGENPFESSGGGGGFNAGSFARQSVSKILTEQLNKLAGDLIAGVEINFDVNSSEDYTTGERRDRTDFNVNLSKRLLNDRLKVSVGSNYELEGPQQTKQTGSSVIGNVSVDYNLSQDGRYLIRGYRKNDYEAVVEGYVVETGLKFIISVDYNRFKQIFQKTRTRRERREQKKQDQELEKIQKEKEEKTNKATTGNYPVEENQTVLFSDKIVMDNRKSIPGLVKDSTDEN